MWLMPCIMYIVKLVHFACSRFFFFADYMFEVFDLLVVTFYEI